MEVNIEADSAQQREIDAYESMLDGMNRAQWRGVSESTIAPGPEDEKDSVGFRIRNALEQNVTIMLVPASDNKITYYVSELREGNTFIELPSMEFVSNGTSFEEAKGIISLNLIAELRDIIIATPNPGNTTFDVYRVKKLQDIHTKSPLPEVNSDVGMILENASGQSKVDLTYSSQGIQPWMKGEK